MNIMRLSTQMPLQKDGPFTIDVNWRKSYKWISRSHSIFDIMTSSAIIKEIKIKNKEERKLRKIMKENKR